jgi:TP901 family phage tail tape measure protein
MADVNATFNYDANFGSALSQIKALSKELSVLNNSFNSLDKNARVLRNDIANTFTSAVGQIGGFSAKTVTITSDLDNFGKSLDRSKLKLRDYYREATRAFSANSNARKLAEDQVRRTKGQLVELGMDAEGRRKGILVTPMRLDMTDMNNQLQVARKQFDIFNRLIQDGATSLINWGKNTQWAGRQLTVGLTVPMTIFATTTIKAFNDVDKELTRFQKVYGADLVGTTKEASMEMRNAIQAVAIDIAKSYGIAAKETAGLAADLAATGLEGKKLVDSVKQTSRLAVLGELDRQDAMATTLSLQNAFNMSTQELAESIDFLNAVENQTSVSLQDLTTAIPKVGPVMQSLGGDVKDLSVLLVAMKEGGINAAESANALKSGLASLINPTKAGSAVAKQYGIDLEGIVTRNKGQLMPTLLEFQASLQTLDDFGKAKIIEQLFGKYQFARISALFDNLNAQGSQTVEVMKLMGASSEELAKIADAEIKTLTESTSMRFQRSMEGIKAALLPVGETITRAVIPFMEKFAELIGRVVEIGKGLPEPVKNFLKFAAGLTAIAGPVVMITGVLANFLGYVTKGSMGFVNLGRRLAGLPTKQFSLLDDQQIAAAKATDTLTVSIQNQASAMTRLVQLMRDYNATLLAQKSATPGAFSSTPLVNPPRRGGKPPPGTPIRRQQGSWVPGSGSGDKVKALLEPGEFVVNRNAAKQYGGLLENINNGTPRFQNGGILRAQEGVDTARQGARRPLVYQDLESSAARSHIIDPAKLYDLIMDDPDLSDLKPFLTAGNKKAAMSAYGYSTTMLDMQYVNNALNQIGSSSGSASMPVTLSGVDETIGLLKEKLLSESISPNTTVMLDESLKHFEGIKKRHKNDRSYQRFLARQIAVSNIATGTGISESINDEYERIYRAIEGSTSPEDLQKRLLLLEKERIKQLGTGRGRALQSYDSEAEKKAIARKGLRGRKVGDYFNLIKVYGGAEERYNIPSERRRQAEGRAPVVRIPRVRRPVRREEFPMVDPVGTMGMQSGGPWVPGKGTGDRIPALLEPGEFVVNKKAAMKHGGLLNDINFNKAPRFQEGGSSDEMRQSSGFSKNQRISAGTGAVGMMASFMPMLAPTNEGLAKFSNNLAAASFTISALSGVVDMFGKKLNAQSLSGVLERGAGKRASGLEAIKGTGAAGKSAGVVGRGAQMASGVGRLAMGALMSGPGIAVAAGVALAAAAWVKYKKEVNEAKKATQEAYSVGQKTAQAYGYELTQISDKIKENAQLTKDLGIGFTQTTNTAVSEEKKAAIKEDNANLIADLTENEKRLVESSAGNDYFDKNATKVKSQLITKYATLRQQGVSVEDADEIITTIARETGDETLSILSNLRPQLEQMNSDNVNEVFQAAQQAQLNALKAQNEFGLGGPAGADAAFKEAMKGSMAVIQYAPPEDQLSALNNLINNMRDFSADQVVRGAEALKEAAAAAYGTQSGMGATLEQLFGTTTEDGYTKTEDQQQQDLVLGTRIMNAEQQGIINESQQRIISVALAEGDIEKVNSILDEVERNRDVKINIDIQNKEAAEAALKDLDKQITAQQAKFDSEIIANENAVEAENKRYENAQKASAKFIKQKQDEIEAIDKSADAYIKALQDEQRADDFAQQQRDTAVGGLKSLASGDVFGFVQSQQEMAGAAQQFGFESEIKAIDERRQAAIDAKQEEIKKEQELAALADERHQKRLDAIQAQRDALVAANAAEMKSLQDQQGAWSSLSTMSGGAFDTMMGGYSKAASEAGKVVAVQIAIAELAKGKTIEEAIAAGQAYMKQTYGVQNSAGGEGSSAYTTTGTTAGNTGSGVSPTSGGESKGGYAMGGYISGAGGPKSDLIPARLSNGEYVVQASAVDQYGVGMMNAINEQKFADGGLVELNPNKPGKLGDPSTKRKIKIAEQEWGQSFNIVKGGYLKSDKYSGSTHTGGGVFDAYYSGGSKLFPVEAVKALRKAGFAAWNRWQFGNNNKHIHAIEIGNSKLSKSAASQVRSYLRGEDGLGGKDTLSNDYKIDTTPTSPDSASIPDEVAPNLDKIATAMGTTAATYNKVMNEGVASLVGRQFGGSMTMNKPYMVGENGPEIVMPYGSGGKVVPIKYNVPAMASGGIINGSMASSSPQINVTVNGVNDPKQAADRAAQLINSEMNRRKFSRSIG